MLNIFVIVFLLAMVYWWWLQGFFSSLLHLVCVIAAGTIAFAVWEPIAFKLLGLGAFASQFALAAALIIPFWVVLTVLRVALDKVIGGNLYFIPIIDGAGGGALGLVSGTLTAGLFMIGVNFTPLAGDFAGYRPISLASSNGKISLLPDKKLIVPVDQYAAGFFSKITSGPMAPTLGGENLDQAYGDLVTVAHLWRQHPDENTLRAGIPESVDVQAVRIVSAESLSELVPEGSNEKLESLVNQGGELVFVKTAWKKSEKGGVYDGGTTVRVGPNQVLLITDGEGDQAVVPPAGYVQGSYEPFVSTDLFVVGLNQQPDIFGFVFAVPGSVKPQSVYIRGLRFPIEQVDADPANMLLALTQLEGGTAAQTPENDQTPWLATSRDSFTLVPAQTGVNAAKAITISRTNQLPRSVSKNSMGAGDSFNGDADSGVLPGDSATFGKGSSSGNAIRNMSVQEDLFAMLRVEVEPKVMRSFLGKAVQGAANLTVLPRFYDINGSIIECSGFVADLGDQGTRIYYDAAPPAGLPRELTNVLNSMPGDSTVYLYFKVAHGKHITGFQWANGGKEETDFYVPKPGEEKGATDSDSSAPASSDSSEEVASSNGSNVEARALLGEGSISGTMFSTQELEQIVDDLYQAGAVSVEFADIQDGAFDGAKVPAKLVTFLPTQTARRMAIFRAFNQYAIDVLDGPLSDENQKTIDLPLGF